MSDTPWEPGATPAALAARASLLSEIRAVFSSREILEVETPLLSMTGVTDPALEAMTSGSRVLQTSPEYAMKRLLAAGSGPIYQVCKSFRGGEAGALHNPEFTLLEWYRPGFSYRELMSEVGELVGAVLERSEWQTVTYRDLFAGELGLDPFAASDGEIEALARARLDVNFGTAERDTWLDLLVSHLLAPALAAHGLVFLVDYPASQAALARTRVEDGVVVAERFELYADGIELANGYQELTDETEQAARFAADNFRLEAQGRRSRAVDQRLLAAMRYGLPDCAGVALGLDRLLLLKTGAASLDEVLAFSWDRT